MLDMSQIQLKPRARLSAEHFHKYAYLLGQAWARSYEINPSELQPPLRPMKPESFISAMQSARRAWDLYGGLPEYHTNYIPVTAQLKHIKFYVTTRNTVLVKNLYREALDAQAKGQLPMQPLMQKVGSAVSVAEAASEPQYYREEVTWSAIERREKFQKILLEGFAKDKTWHHNNAINFQCANSQEVEECIAWLNANGLGTYATSNENFRVVY